MINRSIIAQNITNLSDARYFAAWGIDYLSFNGISDSPFYISPESAKEIKDWVEGPRILLESNALEFTELADGHILSNIYQSLPLNKEVFYRTSFKDVLKGVPPSKYIVHLSEEELNQATKLDLEKYLGCDFYLDTVGLPMNSFDKWPDWGLVVQGSEEEKVGLKSFDELDELYDKLLPE